MDVRRINEHLLLGQVGVDGLSPHMEDLARSPYVFRVDFGLETLPTEPGVILVRGPRQYDKSTWLKGEFRDTVSRYGPATASYLNGDEIAARRRGSPKSGRSCRCLGRTPPYVVCSWTRLRRFTIGSAD